MTKVWGMQLVNSSMDEFTAEEYIAIHDLGISVNDPEAMAILAAHLTRKGYSKVRRRKDGKQQIVWSKVGREAQLAALKEKLGRL